MNARIEAVRKHEGLTQEQFADRINLSRNYLWMLENGSRTPSDRTISDICREFGVREAWLRTGEGEMFVQDTQSEQVAAFLADSHHAVHKKAQYVRNSNRNCKLPLRKRGAAPAYKWVRGSDYLLLQKSGQSEPAAAVPAQAQVLLLPAVIQW
mgnify:CR=1 FL=1